ncbi:Outer membrane protein beta-barrel family protein [Chryseobacterium rhizoplanae]|uniref:Outer membrane protein beta-barrel family protein n=1 Tax=Chryseobacterium rhizoplanae TaxID=1609531 RepID=A0A521DJE2_9FLAO|nr:TonB-dependent receptor [Chryseobacterium rhizoplanae]SMO71786.1 Outer membrane protein beta-barrel family protein [Chryseobacterium rhizoplanae]
MKKTILLVTLMFTVIILHAQKLHIDGKISDSEKKAIENATVYLLKEKDSTIINYTATNREGKFSLKIDNVKEPSILKIDADKLFSYSKKFEKIDHSLSLGDIQLEKQSIVNNIDEIKLTASPVKIKKDTIEFSAAAIKVRPDSKIEELLKQIPGVEISNEGKITVNGKEVDQIMINGKPFFEKNGKIALQNLPADIIKNIQFTTTKTKEEELSGKAAKSQNTTINFNIDEKKNKGLLTRLTVGYGSDKRYETSGLASYFKGDTKVSILASSNNINSQGFSRDEVFDSMGNGRNAWIMQEKSLSTVGNMTYYNSQDEIKGIQRSTIIGLNYSDKMGGNADLDSFSLMNSDSNTETRSKVSRSTLLPMYTLQTNSESNGESESKQYSFDTSAKIKLDSMTSIYLSPMFTKNSSFSFNNSRSSTLNNAGLLNESNVYSSNDSESNSFDPYIYFSRKFKKKGRLISANINSMISESKRDNLSQSQNTFYQPNGTTVDNRDQLAQNKNQNSNFNFSAGYTEPVSDSSSVSFEVKYETRSARVSRNVNDFDNTTGDYTKFNQLLSNNMKQRINQISPEINYQINKNKLNFWASVNLNISDMKVNSIYNGQQYDLQKNFILPEYNLNLYYQLGEGKNLSIYNYSNYTIPTAEQLTPYKDESNPLITYKGNPDLKNTWTNNLYLYFNNFNKVKDLSYYFSIGFTYRNNDIVNFSTYDNAGKQVVTYNNVSGNKSINAGGGFSKTLKWKNSKLTISPTFKMNYAYNNGLIDGKAFTSNSYNLNPGLNLIYEIKDKMTIKPSYKLGYSFSNYTNYNVTSVNTENQSLKLELTNYILKGRFVFGNDFEYNTNSNIAPGFKKDFYFWNTSLGYSFYKKQFTAKVKIYDVLNQNQSIKRTITDSYFEDREDLILKRYIMFSISMKLNKFAEKKTND